MTDPLSSDYPLPGKRNFLRATAAVTALTLPIGSIAAVSTRSELRVSLHNLHTDEKLSTVFWADGQYNPESLNEINKLLRDHRTGEIKFIDPRLLSILYLTNQKVGNNQPIHVISGYRSPKTNEMLAQRSAGVAKNSFHIKGRAIDMRIPGIETAMIRKVGVHLGVGGVGYYPTSDFIHLDTGPRRQWQGK